jgi:hypothetical protein
VPHVPVYCRKRNFFPLAAHPHFFQINWAFNNLLVEILGWALNWCEVKSTQPGENP